jgi:hypothetical protein
MMNAEEYKEEELRLARERFELDKRKLAVEDRFINKHFSTVTTAVLSLAAVFISATQVWVADIQKKKELEVMSKKNESEFLAAEAQKQRDFNLNLAKFVWENRSAIFGKSEEERIQARNALLVTFPPDLVDSLFQQLAETAKLDTHSDPAGAQATWAKGRNILPTITSGVPQSQSIPDVPTSPKGVSVTRRIMKPAIFLDSKMGEHLHYKITARGPEPRFTLTCEREVLWQKSGPPSPFYEWDGAGNQQCSGRPTSTYALGLSFLSATKYTVEVVKHDINHKVLESIIDIDLESNDPNENYFSTLSVGSN